MKIIQINVVADRGSTGKICACIDAALNDAGYNSQVYYGRKSDAIKERRYHFGLEWEAALSKIANRVGRMMYASSAIGTLRLLRHLRHEKPDIVHLHCINGYCVDIYKLLDFLADAKIKTVVTHHAEFFYTGNCGHSLDCNLFMKQDGCGDCPIPRTATGSLFLDRSNYAWNKMRNAFRKFDSDRLKFTAVSPWVAQRSQMSPVVSGYECQVVENGLDTSIFKIADDRTAARKMLPLKSQKIVLHVTASFSDSPLAFKGGGYVVELAKSMPEIAFIVVASYHEVNGVLPPNLYLLGRTRDQIELAALYNAADLTVITSQRETFSMVTAESLCCGTPVAGFKAGGPETIGISPYCRFIERGDNPLSELRKVVLEMLNNNYDSRQIAALAKEKFSTETMVDNYLKVYSSFQ